MGKCCCLSLTLFSMVCMPHLTQKYFFISQMIVGMDRYELVLFVDFIVPSTYLFDSGAVS